MPFNAWIAPSHTRIFPSDDSQTAKSLKLDIALNETCSCQAAFRSADTRKHTVTCTAIGPDGWNIRIRKVGCIPVQHLNTGFENCMEEADHPEKFPGFIPDVLFETDTATAGFNETQCFWLTITPAPKTAAGNYKISVKLQEGDAKPRTLTVNVSVHDIALKPRKNFNITHWFYSDSIVAQYKVKFLSEEFWTLCEKYVQDYASHHLDTLYVPTFTPPLDGVKLPTQLITVTKLGDEDWKLDWTNVERWLDMAQRNGITHFEWTHPFTQWGVKFAIRIYEGNGEDEKLIFPEDTPATSDIYRKFLTQYFNELHEILKKRKLVKVSYFHISDEPHGDEHLANYKAARDMVKSIAPWMETFDALTDIRFAKEKLTDLPVPSISTALNFISENITCWCYYCCGPRGSYLQRLVDTPLAKIAMHGFLFYRWPFKGFLHWGFNYWFKSQTRELIDVFTQQDGCRWPDWAFGDTLQVYPGPEGPLDSIRWEIFAESLQDYQLLQALNISREDPVFKKIVSFENFPKTPDWRIKTRRKLFKLADNK